MAAVFEASRLGGGTTYVEGFSMNATDQWAVGDPKITIAEKRLRAVGGRRPARGEWDTLAGPDHPAD